MAIVDIAAALLLLLIAASLGNRCFGDFFSRGKLSVPEKLFFSLASGLILISYSLFAAGMAGLLHPLYLALFFLVLLLLLFGDSIGILKNIRTLIAEFGSERFTAFDRVLLGAAGVMVIINLVFSASPPNGDDDLMYHLTLPAKYLHYGRILPFPGNGISYYLIALNLLYVPLLALRGDIAVKVFVYLLGILSAGAVYMLARRWIGKQYAVLSAVIFYLMPVTINLSGVARVDAGMTMYGLLGAYALIRYFSERSASLLWFALFAFSSATVLVTKMSGIHYSAALFIVFLAVELRRGTSLRVLASRIALFTGIHLALIAPWCIRNYCWTGNPLYPAYIAQRLPYDEGLALIHHIAPDAWSLPKGIIKMFLDAVTGPGAFLVIFLPLIVFAGPLPFPVKFFISIAAIHIIILQLGGTGLAKARFAHLGFGLLCLAAAYSFKTLYERFSRLNVFLRTVAVLFLVFPGMVFGGYFSLKRIPFFVGAESREKYLERAYSYEPREFVRHVNVLVPGGEKILYLGYSLPFGYYYAADIIPGNAPSILRTDVREAIPELRKRGIRYVILNRNQYFRRSDGVFENSLFPTTNVHWFRVQAPEQYFSLLYEYDRIGLYRLKEELRARGNHG